MTWYANRIFLDATKASLARLRAEPALAGHVFLLTGSLPASWEPEHGEVRLPDGGLVVVKEVAEPVDPSPHTDLLTAFGEAVPTGPRWHPWYGEDEFVPCDALRGPPDIDVAPGGDIADIAGDEVPSASFLRFLKDVHLTTGVPVTYYVCRTWGGQVELECAWVFADGDVIYGRLLREEETVEIRRGDRRARHEEVLCLALSHHGVHLPTGYFVPHTRAFDWAPHAWGARR